MSTEQLVADLQSIADCEILTDEAVLLEASEDFGRLVRKRPAVVARPRTTAAVSALLRYANDHDVPVSTRGEAHSQTGQSLVEGGIVINLRHMNRIIEVDETAETATVETGIVWGELVKHLDEKSLVPRVLTNNLNVTVGGTLSVAGLGVASHRYGAQGDNAIELEVVTPTGGIVTCSMDEHKELYDLVRSGMGQFGIITRAKILLRKRLPMNRTYILLYDSLESVLEDSKKVIQENSFDFIESWCVPLPVGFKAEEGRKRAFGEWFFPLHLTQEFSPDSKPNEAKDLEGLKPYRKCHVEDRSALDFAFRLEPLFELWKRAPYWNATHPWMEAVMPWQSSLFYVKTVLEKIPPPMLGGGHILLWPCSGTSSSIPLFMRPPGDLVLGFGVLPGIPEAYIEPVLEALGRASGAAMMMGGKRYLSGWIKFSKDQWKQHFGDKWGMLCEMKKKYDPKGLLNSGFIEFD